MSIQNSLSSENITQEWRHFQMKVTENLLPAELLNEVLHAEEKS